MILTLMEFDRILQLSLIFFEQKKIKKIKFEDDDYYPLVLQENIRLDDSAFMRCPDFVMGSLIDDVNGLKDVLVGKFEFCFLDLHRLGAVFNTIGALIEEGRYGLFDENKKDPELSLKELKILLNQAIIFLKNQDVERIFFEKKNDCYFKVPHEKIDFRDGSFLDCLPYKLGSLTDDMRDLKKVLTGEVKMDAVSLQKVGALLTAIGETI